MILLNIYQDKKQKSKQTDRQGENSMMVVGWGGVCV